MEAVPRMPMVAFDLKTSSSAVDFATYLSPYIAEHYHEDPGNYAKECQELTTLRQNATKVSRDFVGCSLLKKYFCQLQFLQSRFPLSELGITFTWEDVYTGKSVSSKEVEFEMACVLYNIAALHSILGAIDNRSTPDGMKVSCTHFQCAAWALQQLRDFYGSTLSSDMSPSVLTFQVNLMLAQAQECILEKSMTDNRKNTITAKVAAQIVDYYCQATKNLESSKPLEVVGRLKYKDWRKRLDMKTSYHQCIQYFYMGNQSEEQQKWGERLAYFQAALDRLNDCLKIAKFYQTQDVLESILEYSVVVDDDEFEDPLKFTMDVVGGKFNAAKKDNEFIYHEKIPSLDSLPEIKGASLVKGIPFNTKDPELSGPDIFQRLVPMAAHEASSLYSEEKAKLLRSVSSRVQEKNDELQQYESSLRLDPDHLLPVRERLPQIVLEKCAAISVKPDAIKDLVGAMQELSSVATDVETTIKETEEMLQKERNDDAEFNELLGKKGGPNVILEEISKELDKYKEGLTKASNSNMELHKAMNSHIANLKILGGPLEELEQALPAQPEISEEDQAIVDTLSKLLCKVNEMRDQREMLEQQLRKSIQEDDVTTALVTRQDQEQSQEDFFRDQLKKHDKIVQLVDQNLSAQVNILKALTEANAQYAKFKKSLLETNSQRETMIQGFIQSYDVYEDLLAKSQKGIDFYRKLEQNVNSLLERSQRTCKTLVEEREAIMARIAPKKPAPARPTAPKPGQVPPDVQGMKPADLAMMGLPPGVNIPELSAIPPGGAMAPLSGPPSGPGLKLKDYLPFMKPKTFGSQQERRRTPSPMAAMDQYNMYAATGLKTDPAAIPQIGPGMGVLPGQSGAAMQMPGYPAAPLAPGQSQLPAHINEVPGAPVAPQNMVAANQMPVGPMPTVPQPQVPGMYHQQQVAPQPNQQPTEQPRQPLPHQGVAEAAHTVDTIHGPIASPTEVATKSHVPPTSRQVDLPLPPGYSFTTPGQVPQNQDYKQVDQTSKTQDSVDTRAHSASGQSLPASVQAPGSLPTQHPGQYATHYPTGQTAVLGAQVPQQQSQYATSQYPTPGAQYGATPHPQNASAVNYGTQNPGASSYQNTQTGASQAQHQAYQNPSRNMQLPTVSQYSSNQYQPPLPSGVSAPNALNPGGNQANYASTGAAPGGAQTNYQTNQTGYQQGYTERGTYPQPGQTGYSSMNVNHSNQNYSQQATSYPSGQTGVQTNQTQPANKPYPQPGQSYQPSQAAASQQYQQSNTAYPQTVTGSVASSQASQSYSASTYPQSTQGGYPQTATGYSTSQAGYGHTSQTYPQAGQVSYPQTNQSGYPQTSQVGYPQTSQVSYPQTTQASYPQTTQASYPQTTQAGYPQTYQSGYTQTGQPRYPQTSQTGYPTTGPGQTSYPQTTQAGYSKTTQSGYQQTSQARYPLTTQAGYPQTTQASYPQTTQASYPQTTQAGYPHTTQASYPQTTQAGYPQTTQSSYPQTTQAGYPQTYYSGQPPAGYAQTSQTNYSTGNQSQGGYSQTASGYTTSSPAGYPQTGQTYPQTSQTFPQTTQSYPQTTQSYSPSTQAYPQMAHGTYSQTAQSSTSSYPQSNQAYSQAQNTQPHSQYNAGQYSTEQNYNSSSYSQSQAYQYGANQYSPQHGAASYPSQVQGQAGYPQAGYATQTGAQQAAQYNQYGQPVQQTQGQQSQQVGVTSPQGMDLPSPLQPVPAGGVNASPSPVHTPVSSPSAANTPSPQHRGHLERQNSTSTTSSLDDILSSSPDRETEVKKTVLQPKVITAEDRAREKEEEMKTNITQSTKDPYLSKEVLDSFIPQVEKFDKHVESLGKHTLSGPTPLEKEWRDLNDSQEKGGKTLSMAIARCYPLKNRNPDVMPYDQNRVVLQGAKDDYINATYVGDLVPSCPKLITTQAPLPATMADFWQMVYEQNVEVVVMLCHEQETGKHKIHVYWPAERGQSLQQGLITISLQSLRNKQFWTERIIQINHKETRQSRTVVHLQFAQWPPSGAPGSPVQLLAFINEVHSFYTQQRSLLRPVVVHCSDGVGRTGAFSIIYACMQDIDQGNGIPDVPKLIKGLRNKQRTMIADKEQLRFSYECILYHCQDILFRRGILTNKATFSDKIPGPGEKSHQRKPSEDFILGTTSSLSAIQNSVAKMSVKSSTPPPHDKEPQNGHAPAPHSKEGSPVDGAPPPNGMTADQSPVQPPTEDDTVFQPPAGGDADPTIPVGPDSRCGSAGSVHSQHVTPTKGQIATEDPDAPLSLQDLQNPNMFRLDSPSSKKRVTKANFSNNSEGLSEQLDPSDPFNALDPTWAVKK